VSPGPGPVLAAESLAIGWKRRGEAVPLSSGISLELRGGEFAALVGPNGSGKSTLLRSLVGAQEALAGSVALCGDPVRRLSVEERARRAACVFTGRFDSGWFTVFEIVAFGRYPFTDARNRLSERDRAAVGTALESVGLGRFAARRFAELSDGERQKALIARALAQDCPLLVLDEPTAFLDAPARIEIFHLARRLSREEGKAIALSTHDLDLALRYADVLWLIDREHRFERGAPESLAMGGALGRAFDGPEIRFDPATGSFRPVDEGEPPMVLLEGEDEAAVWAGRLVERLGLSLARPGAQGARTPDAIVRVGRGSRGPVWVLRTGHAEDGDEVAFERLEELADALRRITRRAAPEARA